MITLETKLEIKSWDEKPFHELPEGQKLAQANIALAGSELDLTAGMTMLLHYLADGTSTYLSMLSIEGTLGQRTGSFVLQGTGRYDGTTASGSFTVLSDSGTGELAGIRGSATSVSTHADYPFMPLTLNYEPDE